jgi:hypothetical protein
MEVKILKQVHLPLLCKNEIHGRKIRQQRSPMRVFHLFMIQKKFPDRNIETKHSTVICFIIINKKSKNRFQTAKNNLNN